MNYFACNILTEHQLAQLEELSGSLAYYPFFDSEIQDSYNHFHFLKSNEQIISFIGIIPISDVGVEITGFTRKNHQHQGFFSALLKNVLTELSHTDIKKIYSDRLLDFPFLQNNYDHSEYLMTLSKDNLPTTTTPVSADDNEEDLEISEYCIEYEAYDEFIYILTKNQKAAGVLKITLDHGQDTACLHHVFIRKSFRQKGYGKRLLTGALQMFSEENPCNILLHVTGTNTAAVRLYTRTGFQITQSLDYYCLRLEEQDHQ